VDSGAPSLAGGTLQQVHCLVPHVCCLFKAMQHTTSAWSQQICCAANLTMCPPVMQMAGDVLRLHLPELRYLELKWCNWWEAGRGLTLDRETFGGTGKLEVLSLHQLENSLEIVTFAPQCLAPLTVLKELTLANCGLCGVPPAVTVLGATLTYLGLEHNCNLQLCGTDMSSLMALRCLRKLDVHKDDVTYSTNDARLWSNDSIQSLIDLPSMFTARHGASPAGCLDPHADLC